MSIRRNHMLKQAGLYALMAALLVSQSAWVSHGHPSDSSDSRWASIASSVVYSNGVSGLVADTIADDHRHDRTADVDCLLCLAADLTPLDAFGLECHQATRRAMLVAAGVESPSLLQSILAYQTRAPPLATTA